MEAREQAGESDWFLELRDRSQADRRGQLQRIPERGAESDGGHHRGAALRHAQLRQLLRQPEIRGIRDRLTQLHQQSEHQPFV